MGGTAYARSVRAFVFALTLVGCRFGFEHSDPVPTCEPVNVVTTLALGERYGCAQLGDGSLACWGDGGEGQLGTGDFAAHTDPTAPIGLGTVDAFAVGNAHACAVSSGTVRCWGRNHTGQLGINSVTYRGDPAAVPGLTNVIAIAAGGMNTCAIVSGGALWCWGQGNGSVTTTLRVPAQVMGLPPIVEVALASTDQVFSQTHGCAIAEDESLWCFGTNARGQLGVTPLTTMATPVRAGFTDPVAGVAAGDVYTCAHTPAGDVYCWGDGAFGRLGDGTTTPRANAMRVEGLSNVVELHGHRGTMCARTATNELYCWGENTAGQITGAERTVLRPVKLPYTDVRTFGVGQGHICALVGDIVYCSGQQRVDRRTGDPTAVAVSGLTDAVEIDANRDRSCARRADDTLMCWGENPGGILGDGTAIDRSAPVEITTNAQTFSIGEAHACAVSSGAVSCWGSDSEGGVTGVPSAQVFDRPHAVTGITDPITRLSCGGAHTLAIGNTGTVWAWGYNDEGQLGRPAAVGSSPPALSSFPASNALAAARNHTCATEQATGAVFCAGRNNELQIDTMNGDVYTPRQVLPNASAVAAQGNFTCAIAGGTAQCWGDNQFGQLGDGSHVNTATPSSALANAALIVAGVHHACARGMNGEAWCWGANDDGQLGTGTRMSSASPVRAPLFDGALQLAVGTNHTCALNPDGSVRCIGSDTRGQLGDGGAVVDPKPSPAPISCP